MRADYRPQRLTILYDSPWGTCFLREVDRCRVYDSQAVVHGMSRPSENIEYDVSSLSQEQPDDDDFELGIDRD